MLQPRTVSCLVYRLTDAKGNRDYAFVKEGSDTATLIGIGSDGKHHQFDSDAIWYSAEWAEKLGMKVESAEVEIDITNLNFTR